LIALDPECVKGVMESDFDSRTRELIDHCVERFAFVD